MSVLVPQEVVELARDEASWPQLEVEFLHQTGWAHDSKYQTKETYFRWKGQLYYYVDVMTGDRDFGEAHYDWWELKADEPVECETCTQEDLEFVMLTREKWDALMKLIHDDQSDYLLDAWRNPNG